ncbi:MAG TPA: response regulator [Acetobacteraceae bacterium]|nr:response regulator [Acetobacteraceae bacterium]
MATILVVDDEFGIAEVLEAALTDAGHRVETAMNGRDGLQRLAKVVPDIIFLDYMMPVMNGPAMLREMQSTPAYQAVPVVMMSSLPEAVIAASSSGYRAFLRKPFVLRSVTDLIAEVLGTGTES